MTLDRFDPGRERAAAEPGRVPVAALPGDALVPFSFSGQESSEDLIQSEAELTRSIAVSPAHRLQKVFASLCSIHFFFHESKRQKLSTR